MRVHSNNAGLKGFCLVTILFAGQGVADDKIFRTENPNQPQMSVIVGADDNSVKISLGEAGSTAIPRNTVVRVEINPPPAALDGMKAFQAGKFKEAIDLWTPLNAKYHCLPQDWIEEMTARLGEAFLQEKQWAKAREQFIAYRRFYPQGHFTDISRGGEAQALMGMNQLKEAGKLLEIFTGELEKLDAVTDDQNRAMGRAYVSLGKCYLADKQDEKALDAYLKTIVIYFMDPGSTAEALYQSALIFERMKNYVRAKDQLEELISEFPKSVFLDEAQKKLESLKPMGETQNPI